MKKNVLLSLGAFLIVWGFISLIFIPTHSVCPIYREDPSRPGCYIPLLAAINPIYWWFLFIIPVSVMRILVIIIGIYLVYKGLKK